MYSDLTFLYKLFNNISYYINFNFNEPKVHYTRTIHPSLV